MVEGVEELVRRRLLRVVGERFDFVHDLMRDVTYADLLPPRRRLLHRSVAEAMETLRAHRLEEHAALLGHHYMAAQAWSKAVACLEIAGLHAMQRSAYRSAAASFRQALEALTHLPQDHEAMQPCP